MKFSSIAATLALAAYASAVPVESPAILKARAVYKRHFPTPKLGKRQSSNVTDTDILNFALQLEYLEAQYYHIAAYGTQLSQDLLNGTGNRGYILNNAGSQVPFQSDLVRQYAIEIAGDEMNHVIDLRSALGADAVAMPNINLNESFTAAAQAAGITNGTFSPFDSDADFLLGAYLFEDVGVTAYNGAAPLISSKDYLAVAASILAVEAYHAGGIRANLIAAAQNMSAIATAANAAANAEGSLDNGKSQGIIVNGTANLVPDSSQALAFARTPGEVIDIVYLTSTAGATSGGFFPSGLNGNLNTAAGAGN